VARAEEAKHGPDHKVKVAEWVKGLRPARVTGREIERATRTGQLQTAPGTKKKGRDNRARLITVRAMIDWLDQRGRA
jgi:hypothetical protein